MNSKIEAIISKVLQDAHQKKEGAAYNGSHGDGGASRLEEQVKFYRYGQKNIMPSEWGKYEKEIDPEYNEYMRLKKKFE